MPLSFQRKISRFQSEQGMLVVTFALGFLLVVLIGIPTVIVAYNFIKQELLQRIAREVTITLEAPQISKLDALGQVVQLNQLDWKLANTSSVNLHEFQYNSCSGSSLASNCASTHWNQGPYVLPLAGVTWPGSSNSNQYKQLPFALYEPDSRDTALPTVQILPTVCTYGCVEPYNETGAALPAIGSAATTSDQCSQPKTICWENPIQAKFRSGEQEDIVVFRPTGADYNAADEITDHDFIIYRADAGYSAAKAKTYNLGRAPVGSEQADLPIVADYDGDGVSDLAIFRAATSEIWIRFSSTAGAAWGGFSIPVRFSLPSLSGSQRRGLVAIPGIFNSALPGAPNQGSGVQVAIIETAADNAADRYRVHLYGPFLPDAGSAPHTVVTDRKPPAGRSAVPFLANFDPQRNTGEIGSSTTTELGYLSYSGGNVTRVVAGNLAKSSSAQIFSSASSTQPALSTKLNPFDLDFDKYGNLFVTDPVAGRVWRIKADLTGKVNAGVTLDPSGDVAELARVVFNRIRPDPVAASGDARQLFPSRSVSNIPVNQLAQIKADLLSGTISENPTARAGQRVLFQPLRVLANTPDGAVYTVDRLGRILRAYTRGAAVDETSPAQEVLGSLGCIADPSTCNVQPTDLPTTDNRVAVATGSALSTTLLYPSAIEIVPDANATVGSVSSYGLIIASGCALYYLENDVSDDSNNNGYGPRGAAVSNDKLYHLKGDPFCNNIAATPYQPPSGPRFDNFCPIVDLALDRAAFNNGSSTAKIAFHAASSCSFGINPSDVGDQILAGALLRVEGRTAGSLALTDNLNGVTTVSELAGGRYVAPAINISSTIPATSQLVRKIDLTPIPVGKNALLENDIFNPVSIVDSPLGPIFSHQYSSARVIAAQPIKQYNQGIFLVNTAKSRIEPITNPASFGFEQIPHQSANWYSPYTDRSVASSLYITPWPAPLDNTPIGANAGLALSNDAKGLYSSGFFVRNSPLGAAQTGDETDPAYHTDPSMVGSVHQIELDLDGDSISDFTRDSSVYWTQAAIINDSDIDGDGVANSAEASRRSPYCAEPFTVNQPCRVQDTIRNPRVTFASLIDGEEIWPDNATMNLRAAYGEFYIMNSVSDYSASMRSRPEVMATLLNFGQVFNEPQGQSAGLSELSAFMMNANGPLVRPSALHTYIGHPNIHHLTYQFVSYPSSETAAQKKFRYPVIFSGLTPNENGIKPVKRATNVAFNDPSIRITRSGVICYDYNHQLDNVPIAASSQYPFRFNPSDLLSFFAYARSSDYGVVKSSDALEYTKTCSTTTALPVMPGGGAYLSEALVLGLDNDDAKRKDTVDTATGTNWPAKLISGRANAGAPENIRMLWHLNLDGQERKPLFLSRESFFSSISSANDIRAENLLPPAARTKPFVLAAGGLRHSRISNIHAANYPYSALGAAVPVLNNECDGFNTGININSTQGYPCWFRLNSVTPYQPTSYLGGLFSFSTMFDSRRMMPSTSGANIHDGLDTIAFALDFGVTAQGDGSTSLSNQEIGATFQNAISNRWTLAEYQAHQLAARYFPNNSITFHFLDNNDSIVPTDNCTAQRCTKIYLEHTMMVSGLPARVIAQFNAANG